MAYVGEFVLLNWRHFWAMMMGNNIVEGCRSTSGGGGQ